MKLKRNSNEFYKYTREDCLVNKQKLVVLTGPTAVGKTKLSIELAKKINGEIISADSVQVYKGMDIGSAKVKEDEMSGVKHYLIDCLEPTSEFNVNVFQSLAKEAMEKIYNKGKIPIIVGGTGFYIQALIYDIDFTKEEQDITYRQDLEDIARREGVEFVHDLLKEVDPISAQNIHANNLKRVIRALEFYHQNGSKISEHNEEQGKKKSPYDTYYFVIEDDRDVLYDRINKRVDEMFGAGLVEEVKTLIKKGCTTELVSMQAIGYRQVVDYIDGKCNLEDAIDKVKKDTRHFAKRQLTWFRREKEVVWLNRQVLKNDEEILKTILGMLNR